MLSTLFLINRKEHMIIKNPKEAVKLASKLITDWEKEHLIGVYLTNSNRLKSVEVISVGILNATLIHPREVFRPAFLKSAAAVILLHNHPGEQLKASKEDITITKQLKLASEILQIPLLDHIIFDKEGHYCRIKTA